MLHAGLTRQIIGPSATGCRRCGPKSGGCGRRTTGSTGCASSVWRQLCREGMAVARCTIMRLMRQMGLAGAIRGRTVKTTVSDRAAPSPLDRMNRQFRAAKPNALWVADFTYVATWQGFVYVAFIIDALARRIIGWRVSSSPRTDFVLDALEQALYDRHPVRQGGLVHHSDRGVQYVSIRYTERLAEAGIEPSVGSVGDSYDNALAETINGLFKAEVIHRRGPWRNADAVEFATSNGWIGSTTGACSSRSETSRPSRRKPPTMPSLSPSQWPHRTQTNLPPANPARCSRPCGRARKPANSCRRRPALR